MDGSRPRSSRRLKRPSSLGYRLTTRDTIFNDRYRGLVAAAAHCTSRVLVNAIWSPVSPYAQSEIMRLGGPEPDSAYWKRNDREVYLPSEAVVWIIE